jgi:hypothetical protein
VTEDGLRDMRSPTQATHFLGVRDRLSSVGALDSAVAEEITDDELTELALAADPEEPLSEDAVPISAYLSQFASPLPLWYMPPVVKSGGRRWRTPIVLAVVAAFVLIDVMGLCNTYGILSLA